MKYKVNSDKLALSLLISEFTLKRYLMDINLDLLDTKDTKSFMKLSNYFCLLIVFSSYKDAKSQNLKDKQKIPSL